MKSKAEPALFTPLQVGPIQLKHRIALAPLTRYRASSDHVPVQIPIEYYTQRCSTPGTIIITEATFISPQASGYPNVPGIWSEDQIASWREIVKAVHAKGCFIYLQLWALGRAARPNVLAQEGNFDVVSASDVGFTKGATPRPLTLDEIQECVVYYRDAAINFVHGALGDGVECHGANGYLIDQFLQTNSNKRTDQYGGTVENRTRFAREVVKAVSEAIGQDRTGIRMSPYSPFQGMKMSPADIKETFSYYVTKLKEEFPDLAFIHVVEGRIAGNADVEDKKSESLDFIHDIWSPKVMIVAGGFDTDSALAVAEERENTIVAFGRSFIANPDLVARIQHRLPFNRYNRATFYVHPGSNNPEGYTDYPFVVPKAKV